MTTDPEPVADDDAADQVEPAAASETPGGQLAPPESGGGDAAGPTRSLMQRLAAWCGPMGLVALCLLVGLWFWWFTDVPPWMKVAAAILTWAIGLLFWVMTARGDEDFREKLWKLITGDPRVCPVVACVGGMLLVAGSFFSTLQFASPPAIDDFSYRSPGGKWTSIKDPDDDGIVRLERPLFGWRTVEVTAAGHPRRTVFVYPWRRRNMDGNALWEEPVLLLLPSKTLRRRSQRNAMKLTVSIGNRTLPEIHDYHGEAIWIGPIENGKVPQHVLDQWNAPAYAEAPLEMWQHPVTRPEFDVPVERGAKIRVTMKLQFNDNEIPVVLDKPDEPVGAGQFQNRYPQWKVIDVVP